MTKILRKIFSLKEKKTHIVICILGIKIQIRKKIIHKSVLRKLPKTTRAIKRQKLIAVSGFWFSGSSTVCDMLSEFKNTTSFSHRKIYSGKENAENNIYCEIKFFHEERSIFNLIMAHEEGSAITQDRAIKQFINGFYSYHDENSDVSIYQNKFLEFNTDFLENIIELDDYTKNYMKGKRYPIVLSNETDTFARCSFVHKCPYHPYIFYKFKKMSIEEFDILVSDYMHDFFNNIEGSNIIILDQLFSTKTLVDIMNFYMNENPIKEICVYRDPRDEFVNIWRENPVRFTTIVPANFIKRYNRLCINKLQNSSPNRLCVRFEDMVFDYDRTVEKILKFLDMDENEHIYKKQIFIPEKSMVNVGEYKEFHEQSIIKEIEKALPEYLYERQG